MQICCAHFEHTNNTFHDPAFQPLATVLGSSMSHRQQPRSDERIRGSRVSNKRHDPSILIETRRYPVPSRRALADSSRTCRPTSQVTIESQGGNGKTLEDSFRAADDSAGSRRSASLRRRFRYLGLRAGIAPICCITPITSNCAQCSAILPSTTRLKSIPTIVTALPVGGTP